MRYQGKLDTSAGGSGWAFSNFRDTLEKVAFPLGMWKALSFFFSLLKLLLFSFTSKLFFFPLPIIATLNLKPQLIWATDSFTLRGTL